MNENQRLLGKLTAALGCPPPGMPQGGCSFDTSEDIYETCAGCWLDYLAPIYAEKLLEDADNADMDAFKAMLINKDYNSLLN